MSVKVDWKGLDEIEANLRRYEQKIYQLIRDVADWLAPKLETYAKANAPWKDASGDARQGLNAFVEEVAAEIVQVYIAHGVAYGKWLEVRFGGKYAILWPTIQAHFEELTKVLKDALS